MTTKEEKRKAIVVDSETHKKARINAAIEEKNLKEYVTDLIEADTAKK